jgi:hypothetical protein
MSFCVFEVDYLNLFVLFSMIECNNYLHFQWFVAQAHPSGFREGFRNKAYPIQPS